MPYAKWSFLASLVNLRHALQVLLPFFCHSVFSGVYSWPRLQWVRDFLAFELASAPSLSPSRLCNLSDDMILFIEQPRLTRSTIVSVLTPIFSANSTALYSIPSIVTYLESRLLRCWAFFVAHRQLLGEYGPSLSIRSRLVLGGRSPMSEVNA